MSIVAISRQVGVSPATVSRVMRNNPSVSPEMASRVREAAARINYLPPLRQARRSIAKPARGKSVALLIPDPSAVAMKTVLTGRLSLGIHQALAESSSHLILTSLPDWNGVPSCIENRTVDGVIVRGTVRVESLLKRIHPLPCVTVFDTYPRPAVGDQVLDDTSAGGELAADHLQSRRCKRVVALVKNPMHPAHCARADAFVRFARFSGLEAALIVLNAPHGTLLEQAMQKMPGLDGIFMAGDDDDASGIHETIVRRGIAISTQMHLTFTAYDTNRCASLTRGLRYVDIQPEMIGKTAVEVLTWRMQNPSAPTQRRLVAPRMADT